MHRVVQAEHTVDPEKNKEKKLLFRPLFDVFLFIALLASLALYFNQEDIFKEPKNVNPVLSNEITIDDLLLNKTGLIDENVDRFLNEINVGYSREKGIDKVTKQYINESYEIVIKNNKNIEKNIRLYEVVDREKQLNKVNLLISEADSLFDQDKLTTPKFENAFSKYKYVLALDPGNKRALNGIKKIVNRYIFFIDKVIEKKETYKVSILIENARNVGDGYVDISPIVEKYKNYLSKDDVLSFRPKVIKEELIEINDSKLIDERHISNEIIKADYQITEVAIDLMKSNKLDTALKILNDFVDLYPGKSQSYDLLLQFYLDKGDVASAESIIYQNIQFKSVYLAEKAARVFIARRDYGSALTLLENHQADFYGNPDYHYLLAGIYVKLNKYKKAQVVYEKLIIANRYNAYYWFGLAVALQAQGYDSAIKSFNTAKKIAIKDSLIGRYYQYASLG